MREIPLSCTELSGKIPHFCLSSKLDNIIWNNFFKEILQNSYQKTYKIKFGTALLRLCAHYTKSGLAAISRKTSFFLPAVITYSRKLHKITCYYINYHSSFCATSFAATTMNTSHTFFWYSHVKTQNKKHMSIYWHNYYYSKSNLGQQ